MSVRSAVGVHKRAAPAPTWPATRSDEPSVTLRGGDESAQRALVRYAYQLASSNTTNAPTRPPRCCWCAACARPEVRGVHQIVRDALAARPASTAPTPSTRSLAIAYTPKAQPAGSAQLDNRSPQLVFQLLARQLFAATAWTAFRARYQPDSKRRCSAAVSRRTRQQVDALK